MKNNPETQLRDHFAALAMQSMLSNPRTTDSLSLLPSDEIAPKISKAVYRMADAMLKERNQ